MDATMVATAATDRQLMTASAMDMEPKQQQPQPQKDQEEAVMLVEVKKRSLDYEPVVRCGMCDALEVKYRCPRCERITCSLACCLAHKKEFDCNGKRDRTKYIPTKQFTDSDLSSDFFFLEEVTRSTSTAARSRTQLGVNVKRYGPNKPQPKKRRVGAAEPANATLAHGAVVNPHVPADWLTRFPVAFQLLVTHAAKRGVALTLLAPGMSKRVRNTSYMNTKESKLFWRVEWSFPGAEVAVSLAEERADDALTPFELLDKYLERRPENTSLRNKLKKYATPTWRSDVALLLRKEFTATSKPQYYRLDGNLSLESNLKRKAVVEFPVITVVAADELAQYAIVNDLIEIVDIPAATETELHVLEAAEEDEGVAEEDGHGEGDDVEEDPVLDAILEDAEIGHGIGSSQDDAVDEEMLEDAV